MVSEERIAEKRKSRMELIDSLPEPIRLCVHDYGLHVVKALVDVGVENPRHIRHVVETVLDEFSPTRGSHSYQGPHRTEGI